jgi:nuclear pore complex protein Nup62
LSNDVTRLTTDQETLEQELNFIHSQQNDLEQAIKKLEIGIDQMPLILPGGGVGGGNQYFQQHYHQQQPSGDTSRIEMYKLLIEVDNQLKSMSCDVRDIIKRVNDTNVNLNDPIVQISKILNSHMDSINWIEENAVILQNQVEKSAKALDERYRETDSAKFMFHS